MIWASYGRQQMKKFILIFLSSFILVSCASTGVKDESQLRPDSKDMANVYIKRQSGFLYSAVRTIIKLNGQDVASIYSKEFTKSYVSHGDNMLTIKAEPLSGVFGKVDIILKFERGKNYYFITGVDPKNVASAFLGGMIGTAIAGGPFPTQQVTEELFNKLKYN